MKSPTQAILEKFGNESIARTLTSAESDLRRQNTELMENLVKPLLADREALVKALEGYSHAAGTGTSPADQEIAASEQRMKELCE